MWHMLMIAAAWPSVHLLCYDCSVLGFALPFYRYSAWFVVFKGNIMGHIYGIVLRGFCGTVSIYVYFRCDCGLGVSIVSASEV